MFFIGDLLSRIDGVDNGRFTGPAYQWAMTLSDDLQGDGPGPWSSRK